MKSRGPSREFFLKYSIALLGLLLAVTGCGRSDATLQQQMAGTWVVDFGGAIRCTNVIQPNGAYTGTVTGFHDRYVIQIGGTIIAHGGELIETVTSDSEKKEPLPMVVRGHIIRLDEYHMITRWNTKQPITTIAARVK